MADPPQNPASGKFLKPGPGQTDPFRPEAYSSQARRSLLSEGQRTGPRSPKHFRGGSQWQRRNKTRMVLGINQKGSKGHRIPVGYVSATSGSSFSPEGQGVSFWVFSNAVTTLWYYLSRKNVSWGSPRGPVPFFGQHKCRLERDRIPARARRFLDACALRATAAAEQAVAPFILQPRAPADRNHSPGGTYRIEFGPSAPFRE